MRSWEWVIVLSLFVLLLFVIGVAYFLQRGVYNVLNNPQKIQSLILQLPTLKSSANIELLIHFQQSFDEYISALISEGKMTSTQKQNLYENAQSVISTFVILYTSGVIDWRYFIKNYYYKNNPQLEILPVDEIPV